MSWKLSTLGDECELYQPQTLAKKELNSIGLYKVYGANGVIGTHTEFNHAEPQLLVGCRGTCGVINVSEPNSWINGNAMVVKPKSNKLELGFLRHYLQYIDLSKAITGASQPQITRQNLSPIRISIPSLLEQRRIADILDKAAAIKAKREQAIAKLDELKQSTFVEMFGDVKNNSKNWRMDCVKNLVRNEDTLRKPVKLMDRAEMQGQYDYYGASGVIDKIDQYIYEGDRLLIGEDGANLVARSSPIAFIAKGKYWVNNHAHVLAETDTLRIKYLEYFFNKIDLKPYVTGSAQPKLTRAALDRIQVPIPSKNLQDKFVSFMDRLEVLEINLASGIECSMQMQASLQHQAFTTGFNA